jgi:aspartate kinase
MRFCFFRRQPVYYPIIRHELQSAHPMIVMKFGGTSNKDAAAMSNVIRIVSAHRERRPLVVISAVARCTNELEEIARTASLGDGVGARVCLTALFERHASIARDLLRNDDHREEILRVYAVYQAELERLVEGVSILRELTARSKDAFCSYGERLSSRLIAAGLNEAGVTAVWIDALDFMMTDDHFGCARPIMTEVAHRLDELAAPLIAAGTVPVTQGFIGRTAAGHPTTMGRESSDFSASIIGAAMKAEMVQIWTDVDGILSADPRVVPTARKIDTMSFDEAFELSLFGAKVLHPHTMVPLIERHIPVEIRNSFREHGTGTLVTRTDGASTGPVVRSIVARSSVTVISVTPHHREDRYLFWDAVFTVLARHGCATAHTVTSDVGIAVVVDEATASSGALEADLRAWGEVVVMRDKASICVVGDGLRSTAGLLNRVFAALADVNITLIASGPSPRNITAVIENTQAAHAVRRLHEELFERNGAGGDAPRD